MREGPSGFTGVACCRPTPTPKGTVASRDQPPDAEALVASAPEIPVAQPEITPVPAPPPTETPAVLAQTEKSRATSTPDPSTTPEKILA